MACHERLFLPLGGWVYEETADCLMTSSRQKCDRFPNAQKNDIFSEIPFFPKIALQALSFLIAPLMASSSLHCWEVFGVKLLGSFSSPICATPKLSEYLISVLGTLQLLGIATRQAPKV